MTDGFNRKELGRLIVQRNYDPSWKGVHWRADQAIYFGIRDYNGHSSSAALNLDQAKAARDHLTELIEEIEENLDKPVKTTYSELQRGDVYVYADPYLSPGAPRYIRLTEDRSWSTLTNRINTNQEEPDRPVWIIKGTGV